MHYLATGLRLAFLLIILIAAPVLAQDADCAAFAQQVIAQVAETCVEIGFSQACYGSAALEVQPAENVRLDFSEPGDVADLSSVQTLISRPLNAAAEDWGIAVLNVRASLPERGVTLLMFGDVTLQNERVGALDLVTVDARVTWNAGANLRTQPSPDAPLAGALQFGETVRALGRLADTSWIYVQFGWVSSDLISSDQDFSLLTVFDPENMPEVAGIYGPMQDFRFRTGFQDSTCSGTPDSGILVQSPDGAAGIELRVNGAPLIFTGTLLLQSTAEGKTMLSVLEGAASYGAQQLVEAGQQIIYAFQGEVIVYEDALEYNYARAQSLPLTLLPRPVELPFSLGGLIFPFAIGTGFLNTIAADAPCVAAWSVDVNLRGGPGVEYPIRRGIPAGFYGLPDARAQGTDGALWWRLADGFWVAANVTAAGGACGALPLVAAPPLPEG